MTTHDHNSHRNETFWNSGTGKVLTVATALAALAFVNRHWDIVAGWLPLLLPLLICLGMHKLMHGGHGGGHRH